MSGPLDFFKQPQRDWGGGLTEVRELKAKNNQLQSTIAAQAEEIKRLKERVEILFGTLQYVDDFYCFTNDSRVNEMIAATEPNEPTQPAASLRSE